MCIHVLRAVDAAGQPRSYALCDQLRRAAISVEVNIVEGYALQSAAQFRRHLRIALGSAAEVECLINIADEMEYLPHSVACALGEDVNDTIGLLFGLQRSLSLKR